MFYLDFKEADCRNCYRCLRECPVKAISIINHQASVNDDMCILCGKCINVCHQNAKQVVSNKKEIMNFLNSNEKVIASVAPSFVSNFHINNFNILKEALIKIGFENAYETSEGAKIVVNNYQKLLEQGSYRNLISSACPTIVRLISIYYKDALKYLANVDSPMVAHAKYLRKRLGDDVKIIFIGPCISKKREGYESNIIDGVLTFQELNEIIKEKNITLNYNISNTSNLYNKAKLFPITGGIINSFDRFSENYNYINVDGIERCIDVLKHIDTYNNLFIEMNACEFSCINGPCIIRNEKDNSINATEFVKKYVKKDNNKHLIKIDEIDIHKIYNPLYNSKKTPSEKEIRNILSQIGKTSPKDELNCGACGYESCRDKAIAVYNNTAELDMCLPFMRERAESMSYEIIKNSPNGIIAIDDKFIIIDINDKAIELLGLTDKNIKGKLLTDIFDTTDFYFAILEDKEITRKKLYLSKTKKHIELTIKVIKRLNLIFCTMTDVTTEEENKEYIDKIKKDTIKTTDKVIEKQMRVVQEIASLLGETTAEAKVALLKLKNTMLNEEL